MKPSPYKILIKDDKYPFRVVALLMCKRQWLFFTWYEQVNSAGYDISVIKMYVERWVNEYNISVVECSTSDWNCNILCNKYRRLLYGESYDLQMPKFKRKIKK